MEVGEFTALREAAFVDGAFVIGEEMTGNGIDKKIAGNAFLYVFLFYFFPRFLKIVCEATYFVGGYINYQGFAAVATGGAVHSCTYYIINFVSELIERFIIVTLQGAEKMVIFFFALLC